MLCGENVTGAVALIRFHFIEMTLTLTLLPTRTTLHLVFAVLANRGATDVPTLDSIK